MEGSKRTTTPIGHLSSSEKNKQEKQNRYHHMTENLLSNNILNSFKFITTPTREKTCSLRLRNGAISLPSQKPRTVDNMLL